MEDIGLLLSYIETEVKDGRRSVFGGGVIVDGDAILDFVRRIRLSLPQATGAEQVERAKREAQEIIELAEQRKASLIDTSIAMKEAKDRAEKIIVQAAEYKKSTESELEQNVTSVLASVKKYLQEATQWVEEAETSVQNKLYGTENPNTKPE